MTGTITASAPDLRPAAELTLLQQGSRRALFRQLAQPPRKLDRSSPKRRASISPTQLARILLLDLLSLGVVLRQPNRDIADRLPPVESAEFHRWRRSGNAV